MSLPLTDDLGVIQTVSNGTPVYWNNGLGYDVNGLLCVTTEVLLSDIFIGGKRRAINGALVVADATLEGRPFFYNAGWPSDKNTGATIRQTGVPADTDPRIAGIAIGPLGGVYMTSAGYSPLDLFANGEPGFWYDPSDLSTMFQNSAGTIPMAPVGTVADQPVGLILDKSKGLVLGPELVTNGDFSNGSTGWTVIGTGISVSVAVNYAVPAFNGGGVLQSVSTVVGKSYKVTFDVSNYVSGTLEIEKPGIINYGSFAQGNGPKELFFVAQTTGDLAFRGSGLGTVTTMTVDNISVREIPGNHATQDTDTARPTLSARVNILTGTEDSAGWGVLETATVTPGIADPDGGTTAFQLDMPAVYDGVYIPGGTIVVGVPYSGSCFIRADVAGTATLVDINDASFYAVVDVTTEWQPVSTPTAPAIDVTAAWLLVRSDTDLDKVYFWHPQYQAGPATAYQRVNTDSDYDANPAKFPPYLSFDGTNQSLSTAAFDMSSVYKVTVFAGYANQKTESTGTLVEFSPNYLNNGGSFALLVPSLSTSNVSFGSRGNLGAGEKDSPTAPAGNLAKRVLTAFQDFGTVGDYGCDYIRANGIPLANLVGEGNTDVGAGPFGFHPAFIGARDQASNFFWGQMYSVIVAGDEYPPEIIEATEVWIDGKMPSSAGLVFYNGEPVFYGTKEVTYG